MNTFYVILFLVFISIAVMITNLTVQIIGKYHYSDSPGRVWDLVWEHGPDLHKYEYLSSIIPNLLVLSLFFVKSGNSLLFEFAAKLLLLLLVRAFTSLSTILPKHEKCDDSINWLTPLNGGCYDKIFSGHMAFVALITLIFWRERILNSWQFWAINILEMITLTITRDHYTADVILGFMLAYFVYDGNYSILGKKI